MPDDVWVERLKRELWTLYEAACYFAGEELEADIDKAKQQVLGGNAKASTIYRDLKDASIAGTVQIIRLPGWYGHSRIKPHDAVQWARLRGYLAHDELSMIPAATQESPEARRERLQAEVAAERRRTKNFNEVVAERNGMSVSNLKRLIGKRPATGTVNSWTALSGTQRQSGQRGRK